MTDAEMARIREYARKVVADSPPMSEQTRERIGRALSR